MKIVWKHYVVHPQTATTPAYAACAAQQQGKFWEMTALIFEKAFGKDLSEAKMLELAAELKLDINKFKADLASDKCKQDVANDQKILSAVGTRGTPAFYINGRFLSGARPFEQFKAIIDEELKKADTAIKGGVKLEDYYKSVVVDKGKKSL